VAEPPKSGRPLGYKLGDAGVLTFGVEVTPRELTEGDFFEMKATLSGEGALPSTLILPEDPRVEWQEPRIQGGPKATAERLAGERTLTLSAKVKGPGPLRLGPVTLPYFDLKTRNYSTLKAELGEFSVSPAPVPTNVAPAPKAKADSTSHAENAQELVKAYLTTRWSEATAPPPLARVEVVWLGPALASLALGVHRISQRITSKRPRKRASSFVKRPPDDTQIQKLLKNGDALSALKAQEERLLYELEVLLGENVRGLSRQDWPQLLQERGLSEQLANRTRALGLSLVDARYSSTEADPAALFNELQQVVTALRAQKGRAQ
jgi:hypothetical protein